MQPFDIGMMDFKKCYSNKYYFELNCFMMLFSSFMKVILRMFIEEPFKVDGLCKQVDIVVTF